MKPRPPKHKPRHSQSEKDYFKSIADQVRQIREQATIKQPEPANKTKRRSTMGTIAKPQTMEEFRAVTKELITNTLTAMKADFFPDQVQHLTDEIIFVGCPHIFFADVEELSFRHDVQAAGDCLRYE